MHFSACPKGYGTHGVLLRSTVAWMLSQIDDTREQGITELKNPGKGLAADVFDTPGPGRLAEPPMSPIVEKGWRTRESLPAEGRCRETPPAGGANAGKTGGHEPVQR